MGVPVILLTSPPAVDWWLNGSDPGVVGLGDSWLRGSTGGNGARTILTGNLASTPFHHMRNTLGTTFEYHLHATGGFRVDQVVSTHAANAINSDAKAIVFFAGGNDLVAGLDFEDFEPDLDTLAAMVQPGQRLFIAGIPPARGFSDVLAAKGRGWEANEFPTWCAANNATFFTIRQEVGQIRPSTGFYDDIHDDYFSGDLNHLKVPEGTQRLALRFIEVLEAYYS